MQLRHKGHRVAQGMQAWSLETQEKVSGRLLF
jgi:hypothetical protein